MERSRYRTYAAVDLSAVQHNFHTVKSRLQEGCKIMSVVKADGYGHGSFEVANALKESDYFAVACLDEGMKLREKGIETPILILGYTSPRETEKLVRWNMTQCIFDADYAREIHSALPVGTVLKVHLKIDTGMSRLGFYAHDEKAVAETAEKIADLIPQTPNLHYEGVFTHFTSSEDADLPHTEEQFSLFMSLLSLLKEKNITFPLRHCANSGAIFNYPEMHLDMVRPGIVLYGYFPDPDKDFGLKPALELEAHIAQIHHLEAGDAISYNRTFRAEKPMDVATVCIGYGDGLHRALSGEAYLLVNGKKAKILGRICMDQCIVDVTGIETKAGDVATLIGKSGDLTLTAADLAACAGTIHYEILCSIGKRIPRIYPNKGN
ncbi:MAG: alanine racemase [Clostridia bacterium]|nr:alanine racemase [Clostridia bacterium]